MINQFQKLRFTTVLLTVALCSCVNLKQVHNFSSSSLISLQNFEEIDYSFTQSCIDKCLNDSINKLSLNAKTKDCDCALNEKADSVTLLIYNSICEYMDGLSRLSNNNLTSYKMGALTKALAEGDFGSVKIETEQVEAYSNISNILVKAITNKYRKNKIKEYVSEANEPVKILISFLSLNLSGNLVGKLKTQKEFIKWDYIDLMHDTTMSTYEKRKAVEEYYFRLSEIESKQKELMVYSKGLKTISEGHQKLVDNIESLNKDEIKALLNQYSKDIKNIISEFNKLENRKWQN